MRRVASTNDEVQVHALVPALLTIALCALCSRARACSLCACTAAPRGLSPASSAKLCVMLASPSLPGELSRNVSIHLCSRCSLYVYRQLVQSSRDDAPVTTGNRVQQIRTLGTNKSHHAQVGCCCSLLCCRRSRMSAFRGRLANSMCSIGARAACGYGSECAAHSLDRTLQRTQRSDSSPAFVW